MSLGENATSERVFSTLVSANYFDVLGTRPALGRFFRADEDQIPGERPVVVLTHAFWSRRFASDPDILSRTIRLNNHEFSVVVPPATNDRASPDFAQTARTSTPRFTARACVCPST
jgi:hypothetical protein